MAMRMPAIFCDAKQLLEDNLSTYNRVVIKKYNSVYVTSCELVHFHIEEVEDEEQYSNLDLSLSYKERVLIGESRFETIERYHQLRLLCNDGDIAWTYRMINKLWDGDYPSTVAVDTDTKQVFLVYVRTSCIELVEFGIFSEHDYESFHFDASVREPFQIKLDEEAMFKYIDGGVGYDYLCENIYIQFNCLGKINVYHNRG